VRATDACLIAGCVLSLAGCGSPPEACGACPQGSTATASFSSERIRILAVSSRIDVDGDLSDWPATYEIARLQGDELPQWSCIRGECPLPLSEGDLELTAYLAWDPASETMYTAFNASDDRIVPSPHSTHPYSGDCIELFIAMAQLDFLRDYSALVATPSSTDQAAFLQVELPPMAQGRTDRFPDHRTDRCLKRRLEGGTCEAAALSAHAPARRAQTASIIRSHNVWSAEAAIPLSAFAADVFRRVIVDGGEFKLAVAYADYDDPNALPDPALAAHHFGFMPSNVFGFDSHEDAVNVPARMRRAILVR
jgi:hypothetical protein